MKRAVQQKDGSIYIQEIHDTHYVVADIEIINFVKQELEDSTRKVLTTNIVEKVYQEILVDNGLNQEYQQKSHKKYLKQLIIENIDDVKFINLPVFFVFFFYLGFLSRTFTIHGTAGEGGGYLFNSSLPLPPASQALRH